MFDQLQIIAYANLITTVLYATIATLVGINLWVERARGINALGLATFGIFTTCALHHGLHGESVLLHAWPSTEGDYLSRNLIADLFLLVPGTAFLSLRRRYGLIAKGEGVILDYEKVLREAKRERVAITDAMLDALFTVDRTGRVVSVNRYAAELLGYTSLEMVGRLFAAFFTDEAQAQVGFERALAADLEGYELSLRRTDGEPILASLNARAIRDPEGNVELVIVVARDIRRQKAMESQLRNYSEHLESLVAERTRELQEVNQELDSFAYSISHDLRAPLRAISGFSEAVIEDYTDRLDDTGRDYLRRVQAGVARMSSLIDDLLSFSRLTRRELHVQATDLNKVVQGELELFSREIEERSVKIEVGELPVVVCDPGVVSQVFQNLISNALKYTRHTEAARIVVQSERRGDDYVISVSDNGIGFDPKFGDKIWQTFQRLHTQDEYEGTGIGLAIVRRIVERHGGRAWAESEEGEGATFYLSLPVRPAAPVEGDGSTVAADSRSAPRAFPTEAQVVPLS